MLGLALSTDLSGTGMFIWALLIRRFFLLVIPFFSLLAKVDKQAGGHNIVNHWVLVRQFQLLHHLDQQPSYYEPLMVRFDQLPSLIRGL